MQQIGIDLGSSTVKIVVMEQNTIQKKWLKRHRGMVLTTLREGLEALELPMQAMTAATGSNAGVLSEVLPEITSLGEIPAITEGVRLLAPEAGCIMEIGSQGSRFITGLNQKAPRFAVNEHCAGGTGSFFEDQMSRLDLDIEDYSALVEQAQSIPRLSGRCAVFAKTDIIHRQQEGVPTPDILLGLCYAMIRNYKATIIRDLPVTRPVVFCGGVTCNSGVHRAIQDVFALKSEELIIPEEARYAAAIGAARKAEAVTETAALLDAVSRSARVKQTDTLPALKVSPNLRLQDPEVTGVIPSDGCALGIDIGSTSTDLVLVGKDGTLVDFQYLRTAGDPEGAVRRGLASIRERFGQLQFLAVGITGSGRERLGRMMSADAIRDEITAQAKAATQLIPEADTVFEIGGQDSKFISLQNGSVADFQMNKICAAGTGSFVEEQAARMGVPIGEFGLLALTSEAPSELGERCTVFIETAITSAATEGASQADIAAGLCHSIVRNYLHKVVGSKPVGQHIVLQGGVAYNPGIVAAFQHAYGDRLTVSPYFSISGAYGVSLLALEAIDNRKSTFKGFDFPGSDSPEVIKSEAVSRNTAFYQKAGHLLLEGYDGKLDPNKKTVGIPYVLIIHKFFPMANAFFKSLGFNVLLTDPTNEETIHLSQQYAQGETCYPIKLIYGHMAQLMAKKVDYIFLPTVHTMKHESSRVANNYGCVYMQTAPRSIANSMHFEEHGIQLLSPVFDLDFGKEAMASAMLSMGKQLGIPKPLCAKALLSGAMAVRKHTEKVEKQGQALLSSLKPDEKVLVLITRNYGISDPVLNMGIPQLLLERGHKVITLSHLPAHDLDISEPYPNLYWPFGQHIMTGVKMVARHPNLYAVYLTNHGCGPDSMLSHMVRQEMGDKPYLQIEVDEHFSKVGVITRIEAFLNSLSHRSTQPLPSGFDVKAVPLERAAIDSALQKDSPVYVPDLGLYTRYLIEYIQSAYQVEARAMDKIDVRHLELGRAETNAKEYLPFPALLDGVLRIAEKQEPMQALIPFTEGAEADGQYARGIRSILDRRGMDHVRIVSPVLEYLPAEARDFDLLIRAIFTGDLLYAAPAAQRTALAPVEILSWDGLMVLAKEISALPKDGQRLAAVGTPMSLTSLDNGVLDALEQDGYTVMRAPLSEYLWFLWNDAAKKPEVHKLLDAMRQRIAAVSEMLGDNSPFASDLPALTAEADQALPGFAGGNGRYRWAKSIEMSKHNCAILTLAPRYENTATVMDMRGITDACEVPLFQIALDGDWDAASWSRLRSFLYYC